jgi:predicted nucleotidyltransferase
MGGARRPSIARRVRQGETDPLKRREPFYRLLESLRKARVRFVVIGVWGANYHAHSAGVIFTTEDRDLFLPADAANALRAWRVCRAEGLALWCGDEPRGDPLDSFLVESIASRRALVRVTGKHLLIDLTLVMAGFPFEDVWARRRTFTVQGVKVPVASLSDIVASKAAVGRPKDQLFLATHEDALRQLLGRRFGREG